MTTPEGGTGAQAGELPVTTTVEEPEEQAQTDETTTDEKDTTPDYQMMHAEAQAKLDASEAALKVSEQRNETVRSQEIGILKQAQRDDLLQRIADDNAVIAEGISSGNMEDIPAGIAANKARGQKGMSEFAWLESQNKASDEINEAGVAFGIDMQTAPEMVNARLYWDTALRTHDTALLERAITEVHRAGGKLQNVKAAQKLEQVRKDALAEGRKEARDESGALDLDIGPGSGSGGSSQGDDIEPRDLIEAGLKAKKRSTIFSD